VYGRVPNLRRVNPIFIAGGVVNSNTTARQLPAADRARGLEDLGQDERLNQLPSGALMSSSYGTAQLDAAPAGHPLRLAALPSVRLCLQVAVLVLAALGCIGLVIAPRFFQPAEDAAILYQYADNLARTGIISYVENGPRAEGGTDFLWLVLLAAAHYVGIGIFAATGWLNAASAIGIGLLLVKIGDFRLSLVNVATATLVPLASVTVWAAIAGFSVFPFGFLLTLCAYAFIKRNDTLLAVAMLLLCLFRPDGVVFAVPLAGMRLLDGPSRLSVLVRYLSLFVLPGIIYFVWRWTYFGELLPLPFLVKSDAARAFGPFTAGGLHDIRLQLEWCLPVLIVVLGYSGSSRLNRQLLLGLIVVPSVFYASMRLDQNWADRFYFYFVLATAILVALNWRHMRIPRWAFMSLVLGMYVLFMAQSWQSYALERVRDRVNNFSAVAHELRADGLHGTLAVTEAGRIAYYSRWPAYDLWGLNTAQFAHHLMQPQELIALNADLVEVYFPRNGGICRPNPAWKTPYQQRTWDHLAANAVVALASAPYHLWMLPHLGRVGRAANGAPAYLTPKEGKYLCIFVKDTYQDRERLVQILTQHGALTPDEYSSQLGSAHDAFE
jgi:hypothetical protein